DDPALDHSVEIAGPGLLRERAGLGFGAGAALGLGCGVGRRLRRLLGLGSLRGEGRGQGAEHTKGDGDRSAGYGHVGKPRALGEHPDHTLEWPHLEPVSSTRSFTTQPRPLSSAAAFSDAWPESQTSRDLAPGTGCALKPSTASVQVR